MDRLHNALRGIARGGSVISAGIHTIPADAYHADPCETPSLSASIAHILCTSSAAHARAAHPRLNQELVREEEHKFDVGTAGHALLLEGDGGVTIVEADDWRTKVAKDLRDEARAAGRIPLLAKHWQQVQLMIAATRAQLEAIHAQPPLFIDGLPEETLIWEEPGGVWCRARADWLRDDRAAIDDFKTTSRSANPEGWTRSTLFSIGADIQAAFYLRGLAVLTGRTDAEFRFAIQETFAPFALAVVSLGPDVLLMAQKKVRYAIDLWRRCLEQDNWPAYPTQIYWAALPPWEESRWLERETREVAA